MRRVLSLCFAALILFNTFGYIYVLNWCQGELDRKAKELIDEHVSEISGNLIFTFPVSWPSQVTSTEYTRVDGKINFEGSDYRMVKKKLQGNLLYIVCVKDDRTRVASEEINEIIEAASGRPSNESSGAIKVLNSLLNDYVASASSGSSLTSGWSRKCVFKDPDDTYCYTGIRNSFSSPQLFLIC